MFGGLICVCVDGLFYDCIGWFEVGFAWFWCVVFCLICFVDLLALGIFWVYFLGGFVVVYYVCLLIYLFCLVWF